MKRTLLFAIFLASFSGLAAQSFTDSFESYKNGDYLAKSNSKWTTWANTPGTSQDVQVTNAKAHSGKNSIYFTSSLTTGGPVDEVLPFGGELNTGTFVLEMWMFVETSKAGYFNLQYNSTVGKKWAIEMHLATDGSFNIVNTDDGTLLTGTYSQNKWVDIKLNINLNANTWELFFDGTSQGKFSNSANQIASMDIFSMAGSSFYIDDVSYTYTPYTLPTLNCAMNNITNVTGGLAGQTETPKVMLRNLGKTTITSADVSFTYNGSTLTKSVSGKSIASLDTYSVTFSSPITLAPGLNTAKATVTNVNGAGADNDTSDDSKSIIIHPIAPAIDKLVIAEEATGCWCGWCPRGAVFLHMMESKYGKFFQGIAVHNNDPMMDSIYNASVAGMVSGFPTAIVDRTFKDDPSAIEGYFLQRIILDPKGVITNGAQYDNTTGKLNVSLTTKFKSDVSGDYRIACVIVEDGVTGTTKGGYDQHNYYSGGGSGVMGGFELLSNPVPASKMVFDHVARSIVPSFAGMPNSFPNSVTSGSSYTHDFSFDISKYKSANIKIVGMLIAPDGTVDNGSSTDITTAVQNGYVTGIDIMSKIHSELTIFPNPANNMVYIKGFKGRGHLSILDMSGKEVYTDVINQNEITKAVSIANLNDGMYIIRTISNDEVITSKMVVRK